MIIDQWLNAVEAAKVTDMESAEQLALAAYNVGKWDYAQRWIERSKPTPVTEWLEAKLLLRDGKVDKAAALLEKVAHGFPLSPKGTNEPESSELKDNVSFPGFTYEVSGEVAASAQLRAEMGALHLSRREFTESLDALMRAGFWMDAAYVAERVLTIEELKVYVDRNWPSQPVVVTTNAIQAAEEVPRVFSIRSEIRYLLERRMARAGQRGEAMDYFPIEQRTNFDAFIQNEKTGNDTTIRTNERATALFTLAKLVRSQGMELFGTEVEPDWHIHEGEYEVGVTVADRATNSPASALAASEEELARAHESASIPDTRFHYRYRAAELAWKAALMMPNDTDETARVLCVGGTWLKYKDPQKADVFYKALVRRCRKTEIGDLADRRRWFPDLDENGKPLPWTPPPPREVVSPREVDANSDPTLSAGYWYIVQVGNTLQDIVNAVNADHQLNVTVEDILKLNPGIESTTLKVGQKILAALPAGN
jgi:hypothetical protein